MGNLDTLSEGARQQIIAPIGIEEVESYLKDLPKDKLPGLDGLPYEFYQATATNLVPVLRELYQEILDQEDFVGQMRHGATRLKPKVAGCPAVGELRPITLLNTDYKILMGILARRLLRVIQEVLTSGQLCSVKKMSILTEAQEMVAVISYLEQNPKMKAALLNLNLWKAYNRVLVSFRNSLTGCQCVTRGRQQNSY